MTWPGPSHSVWPGQQQDDRLTPLSHIPNAITLLRIALVPVFILLLKNQEYAQALMVFLVAGASDGLDGFIARRYNLRTRLGAVLDPLADKLLVVTAYVMLSWLGGIPFWLVLAVVFRDALIVGGYVAYSLAVGPAHMRPSALSKINTLMQLVLVVAVLAQLALLVAAEPWLEFLIYVTFATTVASGLHYLWVWGVTKQIEPERDRGGQ